MHTHTIIHALLQQNVAGDHNFAMGPKLGTKAVYSLVWIGAGVVLGLHPTDSSTIPWSLVKKLHPRGIEGFWIDNVPPTRDPEKGEETELTAAIKKETGAKNVCQVFTACSLALFCYVS